MVMDTPKGPLSEFDWQVLGHVYDMACPSLPTRRLDVPLPDDPEKLHTLAHQFAGLSEELHRAARFAETPRYAIGDALNLLDRQRDMLKKLRGEWEEKLRADADRARETGGQGEHLREVG